MTSKWTFIVALLFISFGVDLAWNSNFSSWTAGVLLGLANGLLLSRRPTHNNSAGESR